MEKQSCAFLILRIRKHSAPYPVLSGYDPKEGYHQSPKRSHMRPCVKKRVYFSELSVSGLIWTRMFERETAATLLGEESGTECLRALHVMFFSPDPTIAECTGNVSIVSNVNPSAEPHRPYRPQTSKASSHSLHRSMYNEGTMSSSLLDSKMMSSVEGAAEEGSDCRWI